METRDILMSIRPPWPEMIFSREKPFEFRNHIGRNWGAGSRLYIYESKAYNGAGMVVGDATIDEIVSIPAGAVGPPRPLLRYWAEKYAPWFIPLLDELGDYELPNYKKGTILRYLGRPELLREAMQTGAWVHQRLRRVLVQVRAPAEQCPEVRISPAPVCFRAESGPAELVLHGRAA